MTVIHSNLFWVIKKFPLYKDAIYKLFRTNNNFITLCDDYRMCVEALEFWSHSELDCAPLRVEEYEALSKELKNELLQKVTEFRQIG